MKTFIHPPPFSHCSNSNLPRFQTPLRINNYLTIILSHLSITLQTTIVCKIQSPWLASRRWRPCLYYPPPTAPSRHPRLPLGFLSWTSARLCQCRLPSCAAWNCTFLSFSFFSLCLYFRHVQVAIFCFWFTAFDTAYYFCFFLHCAPTYLSFFLLINQSNIRVPNIRMHHRNI